MGIKNIRYVFESTHNFNLYLNLFEPFLLSLHIYTIDQHLFHKR